MVHINSMSDLDSVMYNFPLGETRTIEYVVENSSIYRQVTVTFYRKQGNTHVFRIKDSNGNLEEVIWRTESWARVKDIVKEDMFRKSSGATLFTTGVAQEELIDWLRLDYSEHPDNLVKGQTPDPFIPTDIKDGKTVIRLKSEGYSSTCKNYKEDSMHNNIHKQFYESGKKAVIYVLYKTRDNMLAIGKVIRTYANSYLAKKNKEKGINSTKDIENITIDPQNNKNHNPEYLQEIQEGERKSMNNAHIVLEWIDPRRLNNKRITDLIDNFNLRNRKNNKKKDQPSYKERRNYIKRDIDEERLMEELNRL